MYGKGLPTLYGLVSQPALIGQNLGGFAWRCRARRDGTDLKRLTVPSPWRIEVLRTTKKVTRVGDYDLLIYTPLNFKQPPGVTMHTLGSNLNVQNNSEAMRFCLEQLERANSISAQGTVGKQVLFKMRRA